MRIIQRVGYYLVGVAIGIVLLAFFLKGKMKDNKLDFAYFPEARVLKSISNMPFTLSAKAKQHTLDQEIDSTWLSKFYDAADVDFSKSNPRKADCLKEYTLLGKASSKDLSIFLTLNPCDSLVEIQEITVLN